MLDYFRTKSFILLISTKQDLPIFKKKKKKVRYVSITCLNQASVWIRQIRYATVGTQFHGLFI